MRSRPWKSPVRNPSGYMFAALLAGAATFGAGTVSAVGAAAQQGPDGAIEIAPGNITWEECWGAPPGGKCALIGGDSSGPGLFAHRIALPGQYTMPPHYHPTVEHVVVLEGVYYAGFGDTFDRSKLKAFPAGSFLRLPANLPHFAWTEGPVVVHVYAEGPWGLTPVKQTGK